jgi:hypothetical protein
MNASRVLPVGAAVAAAIAVALVVFGLRTLFADDAPGTPEPAGSLPPDTFRSTELPPVDPSYWNPDRMRSARPAPMPEG